MRTSFGTAGVRDKNVLNIPDRIGEIVGIIAITLFASYFGYLDWSDSGFMTVKFGFLEAVLFYGSFAASILASASRAIIGRRDKTRPFELASNIYTAVAALWFLNVFPFNFTHIVDPFPEYVRIIFSWHPNFFGWLVILISALASIGSAIYNAVRLMLQ